MRDFKIPKNLNQKDTIGNFTFPQLAIMGGGLLLILALFGSGMNIFIALILSLPIAFLTYVLMYVKRMDLPIYEYAMIYMSYMASPKKMIYRKENKRELLSIQEQIFFIEEEEQKEIDETITLSDKKLSRKEKLEMERAKKEAVKKEKEKEKSTKEKMIIEKPKKEKKTTEKKQSNLRANTSDKNKSLEDLNFKL